MLVNILGLFWQLIFRFNQVTTSLLIIVVMLIAGIVLFVRSQRAVAVQHYSRWLLVPASLFLGWICVATIANASVWLIAIGWNGGNMSAGAWTILLLCIALLLSVVISLQYKNFIYPAVIAWAAFAIWVALQNRTLQVAQAALYTAIAAMLLTVVAIARNVKTPRTA
jgi:benzodiazapine receptor